MISEKKFIPQNLQILKFNDVILENNIKRIVDYKIKEGDTIKLSIENKEISIFLRFVKKKLINVKYLDSIKEIRNIQNIKDLKAQEQYMLYFKNNQLDENITFFDSRIQEGDTIDFKKIVNNERNIQLEKKLKNLENTNKILLVKIDELEKKIKEMEMKNEKEILNNQELSNKNKELNNLLIELKNHNIKEMKNKEKLINIEKEKVYHLNMKLKEFENIKSKKFEQKEIINFIKQLNEKEEEIKNYKSSIPFELKNGEKLMTLNFISIDQKIHCSFICKNNDNFSRLEKLLYDKYPEYKETENYFLFKGNKINRFKNLDTNNIHNNDIIVLNQY